MWTFEDIQRLNPPGPGQKDSILSAILRLNAATPELLCEVANALEELGPPYVCCFAQLPFPVFVEPVEYRVKADTEGVTMRLKFSLAVASVDDHGRTELDFNSLPAEVSEGSEVPYVTQILGFIPLWGRRTLYYKNYLACLHDGGLRHAVINPALQDGRGYGYKGTVVTAESFESELPKKMLDEFPIAIRRFLLAYSVLALEDVALSGPLYGYFVMSAPGRVVYKSIPISVAKGKLSTSIPREALEPKRLLDALKVSHREVDRFVHQLQAMQRVASTGEPELAIVGAVSALEWYVNRFVPPRKGPHKRSYSLREILRMHPFTTFSRSLKDGLLRLADLRNSLVHGKPPARSDRRGTPAPSDVHVALKSALQVYRELNVQKAIAINNEE